jgi:isoquinoline 1-oxidoreductase subunit beta
MKMERRLFLKLSCLAGGGLLLKGYLPAAESGKSALAAGQDPWFFARFDPDNTLHFTIAKHEMGQGSSTGLAMLFVEELGADWNRVRVHQGVLSQDTQEVFHSDFGRTTGGSGSIVTLFNPMREAGAAIREMFLQAASEKWKVNPKTCFTGEGQVVHRDSQRRLNFCELAEAAARESVPAKVVLKEERDFKLIGKSVPNLKNKELVSGAIPYGIDKCLPDMVFAAIRRCPVYKGTLVGYDDSVSRSLPGVIDIIPLEGQQLIEPDFSTQAGLVVIANSTWSAFQAKQALTVEWDEGPYSHANQDTLRETALKNQGTEGKVCNQYGDIDAAFQSTEKIHEARYESNLQAHACMEPLSTTALVKEGIVEVWATTQSPDRDASAIAQILQISIDKVIIHILPAGGAFGRRYHIDFIMEAVLIAKSIDRPVKLTWTREDTIQYDCFHPYVHANWRIGVDSENQPLAITQEYSEMVNRPGYLHWSFLPYGIPNNRVVAHCIDPPVRRGAWRGVGEHSNCFSEEAFIDEVAYLLEQDPYRFRLERIRRVVESGSSDSYWGKIMQRALNVLKAIPLHIDWDAPLPGNYGRGMAMCKYRNSMIAEIAEVEVEPGDFHVRKVVAIVDPGIAVNPQLVENQIEGGIIWGLSALKYGKISLENGRIRQSNFHDLQLYRINETPEIEVHLLRSGDPIGGIGETGVPPIAPAVLNAIFAATGKRLRTLPIDRSQL